MSKQITHCSRPLFREVTQRKEKKFPQRIVYWFAAKKGYDADIQIFRLRFQDRYMGNTFWLPNPEFFWKHAIVKSSEAPICEGFQDIELVKLEKPKFAKEALISMLPGKEYVYVSGIVVVSGGRIVER